MFISRVDLDDEAVYANHGRHDSTISQRLGFCKNRCMFTDQHISTQFNEIIIS